MHHCLTRRLVLCALRPWTVLPVYPASAKTKTALANADQACRSHFFRRTFRSTITSALIRTPLISRARHPSTPRKTPGIQHALSSGLLTNNPRSDPFGVPPSVPVTCDEDHNYNDEQAAVERRILMDKFVEKMSCNDKCARRPALCSDGKHRYRDVDYAQISR